MECDKAIDGLYCDACRKAVLDRIRKKMEATGDDQATRGLEADFDDRGPTE
jgi:hypothetical protein